jgi:hypothetical protein
MRLKQYLYNVSLIVFFGISGSCNEFEHNSFSTFLGVIANAEGVPLADIELVLVENPYWYDDAVPKIKTIYRQFTNQAGEFKFVVPSRTGWDFRGFTGYAIGVSEPFFFSFEQDEGRNGSRFFYFQDDSANRNKRTLGLGVLTVSTP